MSGEIKGNVRPPLQMPTRLQDRGKLQKAKEPFLLHVITFVLVLRALACLLLAYILWTYPESGFSTYVVANAGFFLKQPPHMETVEAARQSAHDFLMMGFLLLGILYSVVAWKWLTRFWLARWATMFLAGAALLKAGANLFADRASGVNTQFTDGQMQALVVSSVLNLAIFLYLAFYPGVAESFKESEL